jgi:hypothetical protein
MHHTGELLGVVDRLAQRHRAPVGVTHQHGTVNGELATLGG